MSHAKVSGVNLRKTKGLDKRFIHKMLGDENTKLPDRLEFPRNWLTNDESNPHPTPQQQTDAFQNITPAVAVEWTDGVLDASLVL